MKKVIVYDSNDFGCLGYVLLALFFGFWFVIDYIYKNYPTIGTIISIVYSIASIYIAYRIFKYSYKSIRNRFNKHINENRNEVKHGR